jgi:hypothetical protein
MQFKALGLPLKDYRIYGETLQDGTPSPDMPVDVVGCGARTENLFDKSTVEENYFISDTTGNMMPAGGTGLNASNYIYIGGMSNVYIGNQQANKWGAFYDSAKVFVSGFAGYGNIAIPPDAVYVRITVLNANLDDMMINAGSTPLPYEPYGYKLPETITNGTDTIATPIYVGSEPLHRIGEYADYVGYSSGKIMRRIKKLVLTGEETWVEYTSIADCYSLTIRDNPGITGNGICSHYAKAETTLQLTDGTFVSGQNFLYFKDVSTQNLDGWKSYLAAQYTAGTPVTVWYVLSEPIEEDPPVPFPELPTLSGTNTLTVDTTVKPSEIDLTGRIKTSV